MTIAIAVLVALLVALMALRLALTVRPETAARWLRLVVPGAMVLVGAGLLFVGRGGLGFPLAGIGATWFARGLSRNRQARAEAAGATISTVRARFLEMRLDHDTGAMDGTVLEGPLQGAVLSSLGRASLIDLHRIVGAAGDAESLNLLEAYLDRAAPDWRGDAKPEMGDGLGGAPGAGPMGEKEAYEILGLEPGATLAEIREAHRRLMKRVHPDHGGSHRLAARVNEAKAVLIDRHV